MILDAAGNPFPEKTLGQLYAEPLERCYRDNKFNLTIHTLQGWSYEQHRHWVETGEEPQKPAHVK